MSKKQLRDLDFHLLPKLHFRCIVDRPMFELFSDVFIFWLRLFPVNDQNLHGNSMSENAVVTHLVKLRKIESLKQSTDHREFTNSELLSYS